MNPTPFSSVISVSRAGWAITTLCIFLAIGSVTRGQVLYEGFDDVMENDAEPMPGWVAINSSVPAGSGWFQGNAEAFPSHSGAGDSYIGANFEATSGNNTISLWLLSPPRTFTNGDVITFYTQTVPASIFPDRMQLRLSTSGSSTNVGSGALGTGDFSRLLLDINPSLQQFGYPELWERETVIITGLAGPTSGRIAFRYFVTNGGPKGSNSNFIGIDTFSITHPKAHQECDFDGDGRTDPIVVRNTGGGPSGQMTWFVNRSMDHELLTAPWGIATDSFAPADYDADNKADLAVFRPSAGAWFILNSSDGTFSIVPFGQTGDQALQGDWDGDGKAEPAVYRNGGADQQSYFFFRGSLNNPNGDITYIPWGVGGDVGGSGDYDGDGKNDALIRRNSGDGQARFYVRYATGSNSTVLFGTPTDSIVPGDYDGDGKTDIAVARDRSGNWNWYVLPSSTGTVSAAPYAVFGSATTDLLVPGDYDGDGRSDAAVWRSDANPQNVNFLWSSTLTGGLAAYPWGQNGDYPVANWNVH